MNAMEFLDFILDKHHEGWDFDGEHGEKVPCWEHEDGIGHLPDGCEWIDDVDK